MNMTVRSKVIKIGNSRGVRIPHIMLEQAGLTDEVTLKVDGDNIIIQSSQHSRHGWEAHFAEMTKKGDDRLLDEPISSHWDEEEWTW